MALWLIGEANCSTNSAGSLIVASSEGGTCPGPVAGSGGGVNESSPRLVHTADKRSKKDGLLRLPPSESSSWSGPPH